MKAWTGSSVPEGEPPGAAAFPQFSEEELRRIATEKCGIIRCGETLAAALDELDRRPPTTEISPYRHFHELRSIYNLVKLIARCALAREESRGAHYRTDFPEKQDSFRKHSVLKLGGEVEFR